MAEAVGVGEVKAVEFVGAGAVGAGKAKAVVSEAKCR